MLYHLKSFFGKSKTVPSFVSVGLELAVETVISLSQAIPQKKR
jgi:hypothetical protein